MIAQNLRQLRPLSGEIRTGAAGGRVDAQDRSHSRRHRWSEVDLPSLPFPDIFTGGYNFHSKLEFNSWQGLVTETLLHLVQISAGKQNDEIGGQASLTRLIASRAVWAEKSCLIVGRAIGEEVAVTGYRGCRGVPTRRCDRLRAFKNTFSSIPRPRQDNCVTNRLNTQPRGPTQRPVRNGRLDPVAGWRLN